MTGPELVQRKAALREEALARRAAVADSEHGPAALAVAARLETLRLQPAMVIAGYWPLAGELDPRPGLERWERRGHALALPRMDGPGRPLRFFAWRVGDPLVAGSFKVQEPDPARPEVQPDVVLVPLLAFDRRGARLGYGKGYYDRTLAKLRSGARRPLAVGVAFAAQEVGEVPAGPHDAVLDGVITERVLLRFADHGFWP